MAITFSLDFACFNEHHLCTLRALLANIFAPTHSLFIGTHVYMHAFLMNLYVSECVGGVVIINNNGSNSSATNKHVRHHGFALFYTFYRGPRRYCRSTRLHSVVR